MTELVQPPEEILDQLEALLKEGRMHSAWNQSLAFGDLERWAPGRARHIASWIASGAGNDRLGSILAWLNWRADRNHPEWYFLSLFTRMRWSAPVELLPEVQKKIQEFQGTMSATAHSDLVSFEAWSLASLRDFDAAHNSMERALQLTPDRSWTHVQHSSILQMEDRYEEALEASRRSLALRHFYKPSVMQTVDCLIHLGHDDGAIELLREAHSKTELGAFALRLQALYSEREDHSNALWCLDEAERRMPMLTPKMRAWVAGRRADFLYMAGDFDGCLEWCDRKGEDFQKTVAENLRRPGARERKRVRLDVPFIRQHNMTCAPATLASLAKYWQRDHEHLAIAEAICSNGTPWHKERQWAEAHDFIAREFRFTKPVLIALIDRGIPFTLTTTAVTSAHLQACIGYDERLEITLLRDPTHRHFGEILTEALIDAHPVQGPRCMLLLPTDQAHRLDGLHLPDEALYDARHEMACALDAHDRWKAEAAVSTLRAISPDHPLTLHTEFELAGYLGHRTRQQELIDRLCTSFPDHALLQYQRLCVLQRLGDRKAADELLERVVAERGCDPVFVSELGELLLQDARQLDEASRFLRRAMRMQRSEGRPLESLARWHDKSGNHPEAARLRRYASCLATNWEGYARGYFDSCWSLGRIEDGLVFLKWRVEQFGRTRSDPWLTLARALDSLRRSDEARVTLEQAVAAFPNDGELRLQAGRMMMAWGEEARTEGLAWIEEARGKVAESYWLRHRAGAAIFTGDRPLAIRLWRNLLTLEPNATDACRSLVQLIAEEKGKGEALEFLEDATRKQPRNTELWGLLARWKSGPGEALPILDRLLELDPNDLWARRERANVRFDTGDREGGLEDARDALARDIRDSISLGVLAGLLHQNGEVVEALARIREALALDIDYPYAISRLMEWSVGKDAKEESIAFLANEMRRQVSNGDCVREFQTQAWKVLPPPALMARLQEFCTERPDLWQTWSARLDQALRMDLLGEAATCADKLAESFPLLPRAWMEVARVRHAANDFTGELEALRKAVDLAPAWDIAARKLSEALERLGRYDEAEEVLKRAIRHEPLECVNHGLLADLLLKQGKKQMAYDCLRKAVAAGPYYEWGWTTCARLSTELHREAEFAAFLDQQTESLGHSPRWWMIVVEARFILDKPEEAIQAARAGLERAPDDGELRDLLASKLCGLGRYDEALDVCSPKEGSSADTREISGRRAWIRMCAGDGPGAIKAMSDLLEREPDYTWGWNVLSTWYYDRRDWTNLSRAASQWARLNPDQSTAHGHLGLAAEMLEDKPAAERAYERAFLLDPEYQFAGRKLLGLQIGKRQFNDARTTLDTLRHYTPGIWVECDAVQLALAEDRENEALEIAGQVCKTATDQDAVEAINQEFTKHRIGTRWFHQTEKTIRETPDASPTLMHAWADQAQRHVLLAEAAKRLRKFRIPEASRNAGWAVLLAAAKEKGSFPLLEKWISKESPRFRTDGDLWNQVGSLYISIGKHAKAIAWFKDWEKRPDDVGSHTLVNLCAALDVQKGPDVCSPIRMSGITRFQGDLNTQYLRVGQAAHLATSKRIDEARELLAPVEDTRLSAYYEGLAALARSVVEASDGESGKAEALYKNALSKLQSRSNSRAVKRYFRNAQQVLASLLPWAGGKPGRVRKSWGNLTGERSLLAFIGIVALWLVGIIALLLAFAMQQFHLVIVLCVVGIRCALVSAKKASG